jgi:glycine oxidase
MRVRVVVVGGGVIGCATADELARAGAEVTLFERRAPGAEASGAAAGMLSALGGSGRTLFQDLAVASWRLYPAVADDLKTRTGIDVELTTGGALYVLFTDAEVREAERLLVSPLARDFDVSILDSRQLRAREPGLSAHARGALRIGGDCWVTNERLVAAYAAAAAGAGVQVRSGTEVSGVVVERDRASGVIGEGHVRGVVVAGETIEADAVLLAAGAWSGALAASFGARLPVGPARGQMLALHHEPPLVSHCIHAGEVYLVPRASGELLVGATVERVGFRGEITAGGIGGLLTGAVEAVPALADRAITRTWYGFRPQAADGLPILGPWPEIEGLWIATGHFRNGILLAPITARLMTEWMLEGKPSMLVPDFLPDRFLRDE